MSWWELTKRKDYWCLLWNCQNHCDVTVKNDIYIRLNAILSDDIVVVLVLNLHVFEVQSVTPKISTDIKMNSTSTLKYYGPFLCTDRMSIF